MNTDPKNQNPGKAPSQSEQDTSPSTPAGHPASTASGQSEPVSKDSKPRGKYQVELYLWRNGIATATIEADSLAEARDKAQGLLWEDVDQWVAMDYDYLVKSVKPLKEGQSHE